MYSGSPRNLPSSSACAIAQVKRSRAGKDNLFTCDEVDIVLCNILALAIVIFIDLSILVYQLF